MSLINFLREIVAVDSDIVAIVTRHYSILISAPLRSGQRQTHNRQEN